MVKFPSIESLRHVKDTIKARCTYHGLTHRPVIDYIGTVKLHGTNAGVLVAKDGTATAQGRNRELSIQNDNFGFAAFVHKNAALFPKIVTWADDVVIFGEWIGSGIQKNVAVSSLPRHFVIFGFSYKTTSGESIYEPLSDRKLVINPENTEMFNSNGIYFIDQAPVYKLTIDFNNLEESAAVITDLTYNVEAQCPWGALHGVEGIGEGIVWFPEKDFTDTRLWFKSKGVRHKEGGQQRKIEIDPVKANTINELVEVILPEWRLEQGVSELRQQGLEPIPENTGHYIKWIHQDIIKEETDQIVNNGLAWKDVAGPVSNKAKKYFLNIGSV